ncbi:MAG: hypothetical protein ACO31I_18995 [Prochlorotrichaceae cyanobacterium]
MLYSDRPLHSKTIALSHSTKANRSPHTKSDRFHNLTFGLARASF